MAVHFKSIKWRNFLSTGNGFNTIVFDKNTTTLVQGVSGSGKSTMIEAVTFALFGKPFRNINKPQLVNSVNQKNCEVILEFDTDGKAYKVIRGIKPAKFEIYCNDILLNQDAAARDYQKVLEQQILQFTYKTFTQVVILGSTSFTPFMQLNPSARREVIEDILDIGVFSTMNQLLKQQMQETKDEQADIDSNIKSLKEKASGLKHLIEVLTEKQQTAVDAVTSKLEKAKADYQVLLNESNALTEEGNKIQLECNLDANHQATLTSLNSKLAKVKHAMTSVGESIEFFTNNDECPTCAQGITHDHKHEKITEYKTKQQTHEEQLQKFKADIAAVNVLIEEQNAANAKLRDVQLRLSSNSASRKVLAGTIDQLENELVDASTSDEEIESARSKLRDVARDVIAMADRKKELAGIREIQETAFMLLRDTGIKTAIIREYLPLINKMVNKYLSDMELFVQFELDESFNETIKSRHRDVFTYESFSEGEKQRIDLALLFTWRHIARLKNSANTNLLIMDETLGGRLDANNNDLVINLINQISHDGTNVFVIAHADNLQDKFRGLIKFEKINGYSVMK